MKFEIGQKVVCVNDKLTSPFRSWNEGPIFKGQIYVIRDNDVISPRGTRHCVRLEEIHRPNQDWPYRESRFEPLKKTSIEIFKRMLVSKELEDV